MPYLPPAPISLRREYGGAALFSPAATGPFVACTFEGIPGEVDALLDTGAHYCIMSPSLAEMLGLEPQREGPETILTRLGRLHGRLERFPMRIVAAVGRDLELRPLWFISPDWRGPVVLGWTGFLQVIAFGWHPGTRPDDDAVFLYAPL